MSSLPISVVIPTYNRAHFICRAVESALTASSPEDEILVVDDGSTDNTEEALASYRGRIRYECIPHGGVGAARNYGIRESKNPLVAFLDSDDEWMPDKLNLQRMVMQNRPDVVLCFSDFSALLHSGDLHHFHLSSWDEGSRRWGDILGAGFPFSSIAPLPPGRQDFSLHIGNLYIPLMTKPYMPTFTVMVRKEVPEGVLRFSEDLSIFEDWECFSRIARVGSAAYLACETALYHSHLGPRITDTDMQRRAANRVVVLERVWGSDAEFAEKNGKLLADQRLIRLKELISLGMTKDARVELRHIERCPRSYQFLAALPGSVTRGLLSVWLALRRALRRN